MMHRLLIKTVSLFIVLPSVAFALPSDREQPINIEADHAQLDDKEGVTQYKGKAILTQGTLRIEGDIITFYYDENKELTKAVAVGKLAKYKQIHKENDPPVRAKSVQMEYYAKTQKVHLLGQGEIWQEGDVLTGDRIVYDITDNVANVTSGPVKIGDKVEESKGRVHIIIQPPSSRKKAAPAIVIPTPTQTKPVEPQPSLNVPEGMSTAVTSTHLNMRTGPSTNYQKIGLLPPGTTVIVLTKQNSWTQVRGEIDGKTLIGWVNNRYLTEPNTAE
jgi:lipopolysaccharide export system protein LptA